MSGRRVGKPGGRGGASGAGATRPLDDGEIDQLQALLDAIPAPFEPLDVSSLDGFLCGVIVQPAAIAPARWLPFITDVDGRVLPPAVDTRRLQALVARREAELRRAIGRREWFDPWLFELERDAADEGTSSLADAGTATAAGADPAYPWVAGFAAALETFPGLLAADEGELLGPLALLYRHLDADDLEDADALLAEIDSLEPPADLAAAVEELVRATLLLADVGAGGPAR